MEIKAPHVAGGMIERHKLRTAIVNYACLLEDVNLHSIIIIIFEGLFNRKIKIFIRMNFIWVYVQNKKNKILVKSKFN